MAYVPAWEPLADALEHVMAATGIAENEAQQDICGAIADREIRIRFRIAKEDASPREFVEGTVRHGDEVDIPTDLKPSDFDWKNSRPFEPWLIHGDRRLAELNLASMRLYSKSASRFRAKWHLEWIELFKADVTNVLCHGHRAPQATQMRGLDEVLLCAANQDDGVLSQATAEKIAKDAGVYKNRQIVRDALPRLGIAGKQGKRKKRHHTA